MLTQTDPSPLDVRACAPDVLLGYAHTAGIALAVLGLTIMLAGVGAATSRSVRWLAIYLYLTGVLFVGAGILALVLSTMHC